MYDVENRISVDIANPEVISCFDEVPLWSAPFGQMLLNTVKFRRNINILDIGCGTGFPMLELAQRFGESCSVTGIDPWTEALERLKKKAEVYNVKNFQLFEGKIEENTFPNDYFGLITSNNGINNVENLEKTLSECYRISTDDMQFVFTINLPESMNEFYDVYRNVLDSFGLKSEKEKLEKHIFNKRKPVGYMKQKLNDAGFAVNNIQFDKFTMRYADAVAMFNHYFIRLAFQESWIEILKDEDRKRVFLMLTEELNNFSDKNNGITLTIPYVCFDAGKK